MPEKPNKTLNKIRINYPGGGRQHVKIAERDGLLLAGLIKPTEDRFQYVYVGPHKTLHQMSELASLSIGFELEGRRFLPGSFIREFKGQRRRERMETPEALAFRILNEQRNISVQDS